MAHTDIQQVWDAIFVPPDSGFPPPGRARETFGNSLTRAERSSQSL